MKNRAINEDWIPKRFKDKLDYKKLDNGELLYQTFTDIVDSGLKMNVPPLEKDEKFYFQFFGCNR